MADSCYLALDASFLRCAPQIIPSDRHFGIYFIYLFYLFCHLKITMWLKKTNYDINSRLYS